jgi:hypothetical protein
MNEVSILTRLVRIASKALNLSRAFDNAGYSHNPYFDIYGEIAETIYDLLGEETDEYTKSMTYRVLTSELFTDSQRVEILTNVFRQNHQPV